MTCLVLGRSVRKSVVLYERGYMNTKLELMVLVKTNITGSSCPPHPPYSMYPHCLLRVRPHITSPPPLITVNSYDIWFDATGMVCPTLDTEERRLLRYWQGYARLSDSVNFM